MWICIEGSFLLPLSAGCFIQLHFHCLESKFLIPSRDSSAWADTPPSLLHFGVFQSPVSISALFPSPGILASSLIFSTTALLQAIPSRGPCFPSSWLVPAHHQTGCHCRSSTKGALGPSWQLRLGLNSRRRNAEGHSGLLTADRVQSSQFPGAAAPLTRRRLELWCVLSSVVLWHGPMQPHSQLYALTPSKMHAHLLGQWSFPKV